MPRFHYAMLNGDWTACKRTCGSLTLHRNPFLVTTGITSRRLWSFSGFNLALDSARCLSWRAHMHRRLVNSRSYSGLLRSKPHRTSRTGFSTQVARYSSWKTQPFATTTQPGRRPTITPLSINVLRHWTGLRTAAVPVSGLLV